MEHVGEGCARGEARHRDRLRQDVQLSKCSLKNLPWNTCDTISTAKQTGAKEKTKQKHETMEPLNTCDFYTAEPTVGIR